MELHFFDGRVQPVAETGEVRAAPEIRRFYEVPPTSEPDAKDGILPCVCPFGTAHWLSSACTGGDFRQDLLALRQALGGEWFLLLEPLRHRFLPPDETGVGTVVAEIPEDGAWSEALQCRFCSAVRDGHWEVLLFDTPQTLAGKLAIAKEAGFTGYLTPAR